MGLKITISNADYSTAPSVTYFESLKGRFVSLSPTQITIKSIDPSLSNYYYAYAIIDDNKIKIKTPVVSGVSLNSVSLGYDSLSNEMYVMYLEGGGLAGQVSKFTFNGGFNVVHSSYGAINVPKGSYSTVEWSLTSLTVSDGINTLTVPYSDMPNFVPKILGGLVINNQTIAFDYEILP